MMEEVCVERGVLGRLHCAKYSNWTGLFIIALACLVKGVTYLPFSVDDAPIPEVEKWLPTSVAAAVWIGVGVAGMMSVALRRFGPQLVGIGTAMHVLWGLFYMGAWLSGASPRGYVVSITYFAFAAVVLWAYGRRQ